MLEAAILDAAWAELKEVGYDRVTMENVAGRAGTSKAVLYRRWPSRAPLVLAAFRRVVTPIADVLPDTGSLREDLLAMLRTVRDHFLVLNDVSPDAVYGFFRDLDALTGERELLTPTAVPRLLARAEARGEIALGEVPLRVLRLPFDLNRHEVIITGAPPTDRAIEEMVDLIVLPVLESLAARVP